MSGHLSVRHGVWRLLQAQGLEVDTNAAIWDDEVRVDRTLDPAGVLPDKQNTLDVMQPADVKMNTFSAAVGVCHTHVLHLRGRA